MLKKTPNKSKTRFRNTCAVGQDKWIVWKYCALTKTMTKHKRTLDIRYTIIYKMKVQHKACSKLETTA